ncbi:MAG: divergent polysaccharide deacetylase family protein [Candidatus Acidiferrales bacterium]
MSLAVAAVFLVAGCSQKTISKTELRAVTAEVVDAAQRIDGVNAGITIRPEMQPTNSGFASPPSADSISISLTDASQTSALAQSLSTIAQRHKLSVSETSLSGENRFDFTSNGVRTHIIHIITSTATRGPSPATAPVSRLRTSSTGNARLAIIIDDLGHDRASIDAVLALEFPLTVSVLPHLPLSTEVAEKAQRRGDQVLLHLPMQSEEYGAKSETIQMRVGMNAKQVDSALAAMLKTVPHAAGVNNHQGSRATADPALMQALMPALRQRGLFFIDSRTDAKTVAYDTAERDGVRAASRKVFLDDVQSRDAIMKQLDLAARDARRDGFSIAIGHPRASTIAALREGIPRLQSQGIQLVFASDLVQ